MATLGFGVFSLFLGRRLFALSTSIAADPRTLFGTVHLQIPVRVHNTDVVCHVYLRCVESDIFEIQGFLKLERVSAALWALGPHISEGDVASSNISLELVDKQRDTIVSFNVVESSKFASTIPRVLQVRLSLLEFQRIVWLVVDGSNRMFYLGDDTLQCAPKILPTQEKNIVVSLPPPFFVDADIFSGLLERHARYHVKLGADHETVYIRSATALGKTPQLEKLIQSSRLRLVSWTSLDSGVSFPNADTLSNVHAVFFYDQTIILNHVILSYWGTNSYLALLDLDEFLYIPSRHTLRQLYEGGCLSPSRHQAKLKRFVSVCESCEPGPESKEWLAVPDLSFLKLYKTVWRDTKNPHANMWEVKSVVDPDVIRHYHVHWGSPVLHLLQSKNNTAASQGIVSQNCVLVVHFMNLVVDRRNASVKKREDLAFFQNVLSQIDIHNFSHITLEEGSFEDLD